MVLLFNPLAGHGQAFVQRRVRFPVENLPDERIVAVATGHTARRLCQAQDAVETDALFRAVE